MMSEEEAIKRFPLHLYIMRKLREVCRWWPGRKFADLKAAPNPKSLMRKCANCQGMFERKQTQKDHIQPVVDPEKGFVGYDDLINRLFVPSSAWQVLCKKCHFKKSASENRRRREVKKENTK